MKFSRLYDLLPDCSQTYAMLAGFSRLRKEGLNGSGVPLCPEFDHHILSSRT